MLHVQILGASIGAGTSVKSGTPKPYSFSFVEYLIPASDFIQGDHNIRKAGFEVKQIDMEYDEQLFKKIGGLPPLSKVALTLSANPENPSRNIVTDIKVEA
jgi:hypothetical protein